MKFSTQLFESTHLRLDSYDPETDASPESGFTYDLNYAWALNPDSAPHPLTAFEIRKTREEQLKTADETKNEFYFAVRLLEDGSFIGAAMIPWISWTNRTAAFRVMIGAVERLREYLAEATLMVLRYAFEELALFSVDCYTGEFQPEVMEACRQAGMRECVRQREMVFRSGRLWDQVTMVMNQSDWLRMHNEE